MSPRDLTADKLTWLRNEVGNDQRHGLTSTRVDHNDLVSLLAMASLLLELEAARKWLREHEALEAPAPDEVIAHAKLCGFPGLNAKDSTASAVNSGAEAVAHDVAPVVENTGHLQRDLNAKGGENA